jgi:hypothetical protein
MAYRKLVFSDRGLLQISGEERMSFLQGLVTQDVEKMAGMRAIYSTLLTPQGKLIADFFLIPVGDTIILDCHADVAEMLLKKLTFYKLRAKVTIEDISEDWQSGAIWSDEPPAGAIPLGQISGLGSGSSGAIAYHDPRFAVLGLRFITPKQDLAAALDHYEGAEAATDDYVVHCTRLGVPVSGRDILPEQSFPMDLNLDALNGIDYNKGCFVGQEVSSRMKRKGEVRKRLWTATFDGPAPAPETPVKASDTTIGSISSTTGNHALIHIRLDRLAKANAPFLAGETALSLNKPAYL